ncbi:MAG: glycosyltransferase [Thermoanaerobaculum sp.]
MVERIELSVVIPVYRNRETVGELYQRLAQVLEKLVSSWELVFVNDGCPAGSGEVLHAVSEKDPRVRVVDLHCNQGQLFAVREGLKRCRGQWVVVMDADLQDLPEAIPLLWQARKASGERNVVFGSRKGRYQGSLRMLWSRAFKMVLWGITGLPPSAGSFCLLPGEVGRTLVTLDVPVPHVGTMVAALGIPFTMVSVVRAKRPLGRSAYSFWRRCRLALGVLRTALVVRRWRQSAPWKLREARYASESAAENPPCKEFLEG